MTKVPLWKPLLIAAVLIICGLSLYPPERKLKPGPDLAGGTTFVYEVDVPEHVSARTALERTITVLRDRVDPYGQKNLIWRIQSGNRIEILMPAASTVAKQRRQEYIALQGNLLKENINRRELESALAQAGPGRASALTRVAGSDPTRQKLVREVTAAFDALKTVEAPYLKAQQAKDRAEAAFTALPATAPAAQKDELKKHRDLLLQELIRTAQTVRAAQKRFDDALQATLATNIDPAELDRILALPTHGAPPVEIADKVDAKNYNPRQTALDKLIAAHPERVTQIKQFIDAFTAYEQVKGPLEDPNDLIVLLRGSGVLEFRIAPAPGTVPDVEQYREQLHTKGPRAGGDKPYRWFVIDKPDNFADADTPAEIRQNLQAMNTNPAAYFESRRGEIADGYGGEVYLLLANTAENSLTQAQPGWQLTRVTTTQDDRGLPAVGFALNTVGGQYMAALTGTHIKQPMAIVLDDKIISTPNIQSKIAGSGQISGGSGGFGQRELDYMIRTLSAGSLQARLSDYPISIQQTGASFGEDNLRSGLRASVWSLIIIGVFMLVYYYFWGLIANFAMLTNMIVVLGVMAMVNATFTLPGIAGLVLTIGMAVDGNVLIYERIREELLRKADLRTAVRIGFNRAFATIIDAHLTTLITCFILGWFATADIKGFAIALGIGVVTNLFTCTFCSRVLVDLYIDLAKPKALPMLSLQFPAIHKIFEPNIDWYGKRWWFLGLSSSLAIVGIIGMVMRGADFLDIEFRGGTQVTFKLAEGKSLTVKEVRARLTQVAQQGHLPELAGDRCEVVTVGQTQGAQADAFSIATLLTNAKQVSEKIKLAFRDVLVTTEPIHFKDMGDAEKSAPHISVAPAYPIRNAVLGADINRPDLNSDVADYLGGVAVVLNDMQPAATISDLTDRIQRMRQQPNYEKLGFRQCTVVPLDQAADQTHAPKNQTLYRSAVVVVRDNNTNYVESPDTFREPGGLADTEWSLTRDALLRDTSLGSISNFSSQVSDTMRNQALLAIVLSWIAMLVYVWFRFGNLNYGLGSVIALVHDVVIAVGLAAFAAFITDTTVGRFLLLEPFRVNLSLIASALTLIGYSMNDTVVIFDRIRENRGKLAVATPQIINDSINQTISRTVLTSGTVFVSVFVLYAVGGPGVHGFAFVMLIGSIVGTYSSIAIASPILLVGRHYQKTGSALAPVSTDRPV